MSQLSPEELDMVDESMAQQHQAELEQQEQDFRLAEQQFLEIVNSSQGRPLEAWEIEWLCKHTTVKP